MASPNSLPTYHKFFCSPSYYTIEAIKVSRLGQQKFLPASAYDENETARVTYMQYGQNDFLGLFEIQCSVVTMTSVLSFFPFKPTFLSGWG